MEIPAIISVLALLWFFYDQGKAHGQSQERRRIIEEERDLSHPFIVRKFKLVTEKGYNKSNFKNLDSAKREAFDAICKNDLGFVPAELVEIWHEQKLLETFLTEERLTIDKIQGFAFHKYTGIIKSENQIPFNPKSISDYDNIRIRLTNGDVVKLSKPQYSLRTNSLMGKFGAEFLPFNAEKSSYFGVIPIRIVESLSGHK